MSPRPLARPWRESRRDPANRPVGATPLAVAGALVAIVLLFGATAGRAALPVATDAAPVAVSEAPARVLSGAAPLAGPAGEAAVAALAEPVASPAIEKRRPDLTRPLLATTAGFLGLLAAALAGLASARHRAVRPVPVVLRVGGRAPPRIR